MEGEKASSTVLLDLNDDCLYCIFKKLTLKDQVQLVNTCEHFRTIIREMIWRNQFQKLNDGNWKVRSQLNDQEYKDFFYHIADYVEELDIGFDPDFYLNSQLSRLRCLKCFSCDLRTHLMRKIVLNCPNLQVLEIRGMFIINAHIKEITSMSNLRELYFPRCSLKIKQLRDIFKHLSLTHLDVSGCKKLPLEDTWPEFRWLKLSKNHLTDDVLEKLRYLRSLEILNVEYVDAKISSPDWTGLFESLGPIITSVQIYQPDFSSVKSAFVRSNHKLTALKKIRIIGPLINDLQTFAQLPALKEFHMINVPQKHDVQNIVNFIAQAKNLEFFHWSLSPFIFKEEWIVKEIVFGGLLEVIRILCQQNEQPKLCLNISFPKTNQTIFAKIRHLVMELIEQHYTDQQLWELEFTFDLFSEEDFLKMYNCIELYLDRTKSVSF